MKRFIFLLFSLLLVACDSNQTIVNAVDEREANEIVVFLASKGIVSHKLQVATSDVGPATTDIQFNIVVDAARSTDAMALLNRYGLPRRKGVTLLELFAKSGLMSSDREETVRYQAGLAEELKNTIRKIDGVIDADVQISFPPSDVTPLPGQPLPKTTAAIYVKHQGILEDPNSHIETKIRRLVAGAVNGLNFEDVAVISDRSRIADIQLTPEGEPIGPQKLQQTHVSLWSVVMTKGSVSRFRGLFFSLLSLVLLFGAALGWMIYRFYPELLKSLRKGKSETPPNEPL
jgi:type III secretion protein J